MWIAIVEAYNKTVDVAFRILDWMKGRPKAKLEESRKLWEEVSRTAQIKGDIHEMQRARAEIEQIDRRLSSDNYK
jgi:hypothetical protein